MKIVRFLWYTIQGFGLAILCAGAGLFLAGRLGVIEPLNAYVILSGSMSPTIPTGAVVVSQKQTSYTIGDIISFAQSKKTVITHRIAEIRDSEVYFSDATYITKGDANKSTDTATVLQSGVQGKVLVTIPYLGYVVEFAKSPKGFLVLIIIPATIIIYEELKSMKREIAQRTKGLQTPFLTQKFAVIPVIGALLVFAGVAGAYFFDAEASVSNILGAASSYGEKTSNVYNSDPFTCPDGASDTSGTVFGSVAIKISGSTVKVDTKLTGATPLASYDLWVNQDPGGCPLGSPTAPGAITTDGSGNGVNHTETALLPGATKFWISAVGGGQVLRSIAVSLP